MKKVIQKMVPGIACLMLPLSFTYGKSVAEITQPHVFRTAAGASLGYRMYLPPELQTDKQYPVVLFLHGAGERGDDNQRQLIHGIQSLIDYGVQADDPAILLVPQCPAEKRWVEVPWNAKAHTMQAEPSMELHLALALLHKKMEELPIDARRVYVTGISMGGFGTWEALMRAPQLFAAGLPICGGGDDTKAALIKHIPIWTFHGDADQAVPVSRSRDMVKALRECQGKIQYREIAGGGHNVWSATYNDRAVLKWFFEQKRARAAP